MDFRLTYAGPLASNGKTQQKQVLRRHFHQQLAVLWTQAPLKDHLPWVDKPTPNGEAPQVRIVGGFRIMPLVRQDSFLIAKLDILLLRAAEPGELVRQGGDLDNRLKTLLDALRMPSATELPSGDVPGEGESPFFCLLEDDGLVTELSISTDRLLVPAIHASQVQMIIKVQVRATRNLSGNIAFM